MRQKRIGVLVFTVVILVLAVGASSATAVDASSQTGERIDRSTAIGATATSGSVSSLERSRRCHRSYPTVCLKTGIGDWDCAGGSGNGPNYVRAKNFRVKGSDPFRLDGDRDGVGCETY